MTELSEREAAEILRGIAAAFVTAVEVFEEYEKRMIREAQRRGWLRREDIEACMWIADRFAGAPSADDAPFPFLKALWLEGFLTRADIGRLNAELLSPPSPLDPSAAREDRDG